ncbi:50S ribosomal protein L15 [Candidatus Kaiserbacteria bacterium CG10_big_fil_rev_8_21_14_0_10_59_10]|uniref:Large ribosomal subunit protein uL15 n=1 Tax=Candidatus Kaiserbacteria bacterium CG10_big_fil_rev_8_21_14_0_10_59_10 TaxID=1974612 RepID=A0A2H0U8R6_9BACT|nr:MAG: 50S ribosomal protein L15 [Candidatus Kaiserbacteria bacterium CG10_big_fil_rev_8_21_14_0_10_59_10]
MSTGLHTLRRVTARPKRRLGRGQSSGAGKTSGRGTKGQNARAGRKKRPEMRDIIKKLPKRRGFGKNRARTVVGNRVRAVPVALSRLDAAFESGASVTPQDLVERGIVKRRGRTIPPIKITAGETSKKLSITGCAISASARAALEKAGGSAT